jgi:hypothetical protein
MLILAAGFGCVVALDTTPGPSLQTPLTDPQENTAIMADTLLPFGNRFGLPFTREEFKRSLQFMMTADEAELQAALLYEADPEAIGIWIADLNLLLLAALSDEVAQRVIAYRPGLRDAVLRVRENPEAFVAAFRRAPPAP